MSTVQIQNDIIDDFKILDGDLEMTLNYLMELGESLNGLDEKYKIDDNLVKGCQSKVWLKCTKEDNKIYLEGDSNTAITKGLLIILIKIFNKKWNYFDNMDDQQIEFFIKSDLTWHKSTKTFGSSDNFFNILIVGVHYSSRYGGSEKYIQKQHREIQNKILYLKDKSHQDVLDEFQKDFLKKSEEGNLTQDEYYFLWKIFCESKNMPLIIYKQEFLNKISNYPNMTSDYLIGIRHFRTFWTETIVVDKNGEYEISELNELFTIWLNGNKVNTVNEYQLLDIKIGRASCRERV